MSTKTSGNFFKDILKKIDDEFNRALKDDKSAIYEEILKTPFAYDMDVFEYARKKFNGDELLDLFDILGFKAALFEDQTISIFQWVHSQLTPQKVPYFFSISPHRDELDGEKLRGKKRVHFELLKEKISSCNLSTKDLIYERFLNNYLRNLFDPRLIGFDQEQMKKIKKSLSKKVLPSQILNHLNPVLDFYSLSPISCFVLLNYLQKAPYVDSNVLSHVFESLTCKGVNFRQPIYSWSSEPETLLSRFCLCHNSPRAIEFFIEKKLNLIQVKYKPFSISHIEDENKIKKSILHRVSHDRDWECSDVEELSALFEKKQLESSVNIKKTVRSSCHKI